MDRPVVIICDPQRAVGEAIAAAVEEAGRARVASCTTSVGRALALEAALRPEVAVVAARSWGRPLGAVVSAFHQASPRLAIVVLTGVRHHEAVVSDPAWNVQYLDLGAHLSDLVTAIQLGAALRSRGDSSKDRGHHPGVDGRGELTGREWQILECMAEGLDATGIGRRLSISTQTARTHLKNIYRRLGVHSGPEAVAAARRI